MSSLSKSETAHLVCSATLKRSHPAFSCIDPANPLHTNGLHDCAWKDHFIPEIRCSYKNKVL